MIRKNDNMRSQILERAADLEDEREILSSPTRRARELRSTSLALHDENEMLKYKLKLRTRLRNRVRTMRAASITTWKAYGGRGKTRDLALSHAKISALELECEELQSTHLDALREGLNASISTNEAIQKLGIMTDHFDTERQRRTMAEAHVHELRKENQEKTLQLEELHLKVASMEAKAEEFRIQEIQLKTSEQMLRKSAHDEHTAATHLKRRLVQARSDQEESQTRERKLRIHIAGIAAAGVGVGGIAGLRLGNSVVGGTYLDQSLYTSAYNLSPTARRYYLDNVFNTEAAAAAAATSAAATSALYQSSSSPAAAAAAIAHQIDRDLELATAVDRDVDAVRRARDRQRLAILRSEADLGLLSSSNDLVERTLLESQMDVDAAIGSSGSYLSRMNQIEMRDL